MIWSTPVNLRLTVINMYWGNGLDKVDDVIEVDKIVKVSKIDDVIEVDEVI